MEEVTIKADRSSGQKIGKPVVITWKGVKMVRNHSIRAVANELKNMSSNQDLISVNFIGKQSTGKSSIMLTLAHLIHQMADEEYVVKVIGRHEFINLEETAANLKPVAHILIFEDLAFLKANATTKQIDNIQFILSTIRHLPGGKDIRIIIFKAFQYSRSLPTFLRQNDATLISSVDDNEMKSLTDMLGQASVRQLNLLKRMQVQVKRGAKDQSFFHYPLGNRGTKYLKYHAKHPFLPYLYYNGDTSRMVVSPLRTWIDPICSVCDDPEKIENNHSTMKNFVADFSTKFGHERTAKEIIKIMMMKKGINCYPKRIAQGVRYVEVFLAQKL
ncbi:MAG: hypothetical protein IIB02_09150, partial [Thaumarchaeota archaeon]|nr:hypothetical protein [Nitrososphaerota archaeon]